MSVSLKKGQRVSLKKEDASLNKLMVGLGWDPTKRGQDADLDASVFEVGEKGFLSKSKRVIDEISYRNLESDDEAIKHHGDNLTGDGDGDDEQISIDLKKVTKKAKKLICVVNIYQAFSRKQDFGMIKNAYIRLVNEETGKELCRYDLTEDYDRESAVVFGELYRHNGGWKFRAVGQGYNGGLAALCKSYGILVED